MGVMVDQMMEPSQTKKVPAFTALSKTGVSVWGYRSGDDTTSLKEVTAEEAGTKDDVWYDLQGRRVNTPAQKGVYIRNGRKVFVK